MRMHVRVPTVYCMHKSICSRACSRTFICIPCLRAHRYAKAMQTYKRVRVLRAGACMCMRALTAFCLLLSAYCFLHVHAKPLLALAYICAHAYALTHICTRTSMHACMHVHAPYAVIKHSTKRLLRRVYAHMHPQKYREERACVHACTCARAPIRIRMCARPFTTYGCADTRALDSANGYAPRTCIHTCIHA